MKTAAVALLFSVSCAVMLSSADAAANVFFIHTDHLDTPRVVSDLAGNKVWIADYDAFGKATITSNTLAPYTSAMNVRFPGQYFDAETSTHYNYFRDYDPLIGRYLQSDPIGLEGGINTYAYAENNPLRYADPLGLRGLTGQEKHLLEPYIPQEDLDNADIHVGSMPFYAPQWASGITRGNDIYFRNPDKKFCTPNDLADLAHELVHVGQYRWGMTWASYLIASRRGYGNSPYEKRPYELQAQVASELSAKDCECQ